MSRDLSLLEPTFRNHVDQLLSDCESEGISMTVYFTDRSPYEQAVLWRQSRTTEQIVRAVSTLQDNGASFLANCLEVVGPHQGRKVTNALPGLSWHQWGKTVSKFTRKQH
jgi:peptidoglycan L-alanyl-D-glutamate endopeptidase CwlK